MKAYKKDLTTELTNKVRYNEHTRSYENNWNGRDPILTYLSARQTKRWINTVNGGHFLGWNNNQMVCPHCGENDSIEHTFMKCKCLGDNKHALKISLQGQHDVKDRVRAVHQIINIDMEREKKVMLNEITKFSDMTNKRVRVRKPNSNVWISGTISNFSRHNNTTTIELDDGNIKKVNLFESVTHNRCWINGMCDHRHPNHQVLPFHRQVTVPRADGHTVANCTNLTLK